MRNNILSRESAGLLLWNLFFLGLLLLVFNEKTYILSVLCYGIFLYWKYKLSVLETLFFLVIFSLPFERGIRGWTIEVVPPGPEAWFFGYSFYFGFSLKIIFLIASILLYITEHKRSLTNRRFLICDWILIAVTVLAALSALLADRLSLGLLGLVRLFSGIWIYFLSRQMFISQRVKALFFTLLIAQLTFFGFIGTLQTLTGHSLGVFLEDNAFANPNGYFTIDGASLFRASGLGGHPTFFGSFLSMLLPVAIGYLLTSKIQSVFGRKQVIITASAILLGLIAVVGTNSRSAWASLIIITIMFYWWSAYNKVRFSFPIKKIVFIVLSLITIFVISNIPFIAARIQTFGGLWNINRGIGRYGLIEHAFSMIWSFPLFGVGLNHFTQILHQQILLGDVQTFFFPVHNTILLFAAEMGLPAAILFIFFVIKQLQIAWNKSKNNFIFGGIFIGAITFIFNSQFHTLFTQDPTFETFMLFLGFLSTI